MATRTTFGTVSLSVCGSSRGHDDINWQPEHVRHESREPIEVAVRPPVLNGNVLPFDPSELSQPLPERVSRWRACRRAPVAEKANPRHLPGLLRLREWREKRDE
jgi:hypothetical protein